MLRGHLDTVAPHRISGWAMDDDCPDVPVTLLITANDILLARVVARSPRDDLREAGLGDGRCAFDINPGTMLTGRGPHLIAVCRESDGAHLVGSPAAVDLNTVFADEEQARLRALLEAPSDVAELERRLVLLAEVSDRLRRMATDRHTIANASAPRALVIDEALPRAGWRTDATRALAHLAALRRLGFAVTIVAADLQPSDTSDVVAVGAMARQPPSHASIEEVLRRDAGAFDVVILRHVGVATCYLPLVRAYQPRARVLFDIGHLASSHLARQAEVEVRPDLGQAIERARAGEIMAALTADAVLLASSHEIECLRSARVPAERIGRVAWSVAVQPVMPPFEQRGGVAFVGHFGQAANVDAAHHLVKTIMPLVWDRVPTIQCVLAGRAMPASVLALAGPRIVVMPDVDDMAKVYATARLTAAPLRFGAGLKGKVVESLAAGIPCVCSPIAAEGLDLPPPLQSRVRATPEALADQIVALHTSQAENHAAADAGIAFVTARFSEAALDAALRAAIGPVLRQV